jgi:hypothetical protein
MESASPIRPIDYRSGTFYALATAVLVSFQEPFSALAARSLSSLDFMAFTQLALLFSIPLLILRMDSRRDFTAIVFGARNWPKLGVIFLVRGGRAHAVRRRAQSELLAEIIRKGGLTRSESRCRRLFANRVV